MMKKSVAPLAQESGQTVLEFALTLTITLLLIFGLMEFSRVIYTASVIQWAAQYGARTGITNAGRPDLDSTVETEVLGRLTGLDPAQATVAVTQPATEIVQVDVTYRFEFIAPLITLFTGEELDLQASASMVVQ